MGRGSSKASNGMTGVNTGATVVDSHPLADEIGQGGGAFANEIMNTRDAFEREWGDAITDVNLSVATFNERGVLGAYGQDTLYMNEKYVKNANLTEAMNNSGNYHPGIGNKTGAEAVAAHELSHRLGEVASKRAGISEQEIVARAAKKLGMKTENVAGRISEYARSNYSETIAEAGADVYCNGSKASRASKAVIAEVRSILKK